MTFTSPTNIRTMEVAGRGLTCEGSLADINSGYTSLTP
jgi:hypothetical protein